MEEYSSVPVYSEDLDECPAPLSAVTNTLNYFDRRTRQDRTGQTEYKNTQRARASLVTSIARVTVEVVLQNLQMYGQN